MDEEGKQSFTRGLRWRHGFNVAIAVLSAFAILAMVNYLAARHSWRYNWSNAAANRLSPLTVKVLGALTNDVKVIVYFDPDEPLYSSVSGMIKDYESHSPRLQVEFVDYRYPGRATVIRNDYRLEAGSESGRIIFDCAGRTKTVLAGELSEFKVTEKEIRRAGFKGEQLFTQAIVSVTTPRKVKAYFLGGHGEGSPLSSDDQTGFSRFATMLKEADVPVDMFEALHSRDVPEDCSMLVIAGPTTPFNREEIERLDKYLSGGGRLFVMFNMFNAKIPRLGLEDLLANWSIDVGANYVSDKPRMGTKDAILLLTSQFGAHQITRPLLRSTVTMVLPRTVSPREGAANRADAAKPIAILFTGDQGIAYGPAGQTYATGELPIAVAAEKGGIQGVAADRGATRVVAIGSSAALANRILTEGANADFAILAANWLLSRDVFLSGEIPPRAIAEYRINVTEQQMKTLRMVFLGAAPWGALLVGVVVWMRRRH